MKIDLTPPARSSHDDYDYEEARSNGLIHRPLVGGSWVTHYEIRIAYKLGHFAAFPAMTASHARGRIRRLQCDMIKLEIARRGFYIKKVYHLDSDTHRLCRIGVRNHD